jgi:hypothetical protein
VTAARGKTRTKIPHLRQAGFARLVNAVKGQGGALFRGFIRMCTRIEMLDQELAVVRSHLAIVTF